MSSIERACQGRSDQRFQTCESLPESSANWETLSSVPVAEGLNDIFGRDKFDRYVIREDRERFLVAFLRAAIAIEITEPIAACRDPKDDKFLELAVSGGATCIVTEDNDLLALHPFRGIPIVSVEQFLASF